MDAHQYLRNQVAPPGSNLYYSLLFAAPHARRPLCAVAAWQQEARLLAFAPRERSTALARIEWWRQEAERLRTASPRHPIAVALAAEGTAPLDAASERVHRMLDTVHCLVLEERAKDEEDLWQHCDALASEGEKMVADALAAARGAAPGVPDGLGRGLEMLELTRPPPGHRRLPPRMVPLACDEALGGGPEGAPAGHCNAALRTLLRPRVERGERLLRGALRRLGERPHSSERSRVVLARLALAHFEVLARGGCRRWDTGTPPLRKLWIAWRAARRCP